jgi:hypothetical protein
MLEIEKCFIFTFGEWKLSIVPAHQMFRPNSFSELQCLPNLVNTNIHYSSSPIFQLK